MSNHNYSQYSNKKNNNSKNYNRPKTESEFINAELVKYTDETVVAPEVDVNEIVPIFEENSPKIKMVVETVDTAILPKTVTGTVSGCSKLNVRAKPTTDAEVLGILNSDSEVEIDPARSTAEWVKITTAAGIDGYCMRKFVNAKL